VICAALKEKVRGREFDFQGRRAAVSLSLGLSLFERGKTVDDCLREADQEMYRQKRSRA
jgi:PleD family two-component response regulator